MKKVLIVRRRALGNSSTEALCNILNNSGEISSIIWRHDRPFPTQWLNSGPEESEETVTVLRWGCTATLTGLTSGQYMNKAAGIHQVNDKMGFLQKLSLLENQSGLLPLRTSTTDQAEWIQQGMQWVIRPRHHSRGRNLRTMTTPELPQHLLPNHYARPLVKKKAEYRVYVMNGLITMIAQKTPGNPEDIAWNVAQGGRFDNVRWDNWPTNICELACRIYPETGLTFTGIDIMVDHEDQAWFIEANSAPTLPYNSDGSLSYRQKTMGKAFAYDILNNNQQHNQEVNYEGWRACVHPAVWRRD